MAAHDRKTNHTRQSLLLVGVTLLAMVSGMAGIIHKAAEMGPQVGDVVAFDPAHQTSFTSVARLTATRPSLSSCVLDLATLQRSGGSLVVEQRGIEPDYTFLAHWAGPRTTDDAKGCGTQADLALTQSDINTLATAAGGFGVDHSAFLLR